VDATADIDFTIDTEVVPTAGLMLKPMKNLRLGYCFHNALELFVDPVIVRAETHIFGDPLVLPINITLNFSGYYWPQQHNFGISYRWIDQLLVSVELSWFRWSEFTSGSRGAPDPPWHDTLVPRIGLEFDPTSRLALRCGYFYEPSPIPDQTKISNYLDNDRHAFSFGLGYTFMDPLRVIKPPIVTDIVFQYIHMPTRKTIKPSGVPGGFETEGEVFSVGFNVTLNF